MAGEIITDGLDEPWTDPELEKLGVRTVLEGGGLFCGVTHEEYAINGHTYAWPKSIIKLRWSMNFSRLGKLSDMDFKDCATAWLAEIAACCNREYEYTANPRLANILYTVERLDGPRGVLANMQLPVGNVTPDTQLIGRFDDSEAWVISETPQQGEIDLYTVGGHETQHAEGLGHLPSNIAKPARIAPMYNPKMRTMQADTDIAELLRRNGPRAIVPAPTPTPAPVPGSAPVNYEGVHTIEQSGKMWRGTVKGVLERVK